MSGLVRILAAITLLVAAWALFPATPASARGAAPSVMNSPGYQRALEDSRRRYRDSVGEPYLRAPTVYPRKKWRTRGRRN